MILNITHQHHNPQTQYSGLNEPRVSHLRVKIYMQSTRKAAQVARDLVYFTGQPCKHGHVANRRTDSGSCVECQRTAQSTARQHAMDVGRAERDGVRLYCYPLHDDDHPKVLAYCQMLDTQRGRTPTTPDVPLSSLELTAKRLGLKVATPEDMAAEIAIRYKRLTVAPPQPPREWKP